MICFIMWRVGDKGMNMKGWYENNKVSIWITVILTIVTILIIVYVGMQVQYCMDHPDKEMCQMKNATGIINLVVR